MTANGRPPANSGSTSVHITNYYHKNSGGISTSFNNLLAAAERHRRQVRLIVPGETESVEDVNDFARIYYVPAKRSPIFDKRYRVMMPWQYMLSGSAIRRILLNEKPDIIEVTDKYTLSILGPMIRTNNFKKIGRPMLVHFSCERMDDNIGSFISRGRFGKWVSRTVIGNYTLPSFDFHIANSSYTAEEFFDAADQTARPRKRPMLDACRRFLREPDVPVEERVFVCPRGVDPERFSPSRRSDEIKDQMRSLAGASTDPILLLYAGRISPEKNVGLLVDLMKILANGERDFRLLVAGDGPKKQWLREQAEKISPGKVVMLGHVDKDRLADLYANADVFVHPNPKEPFGIAPLEAMASGVPTVAPNAGGILSYATNDNAWLVEPTGEAFAAAVREVVDDPELTNSKIEKALETARQNTGEISTDRLLSTYDKMFADFQRRKDHYVRPPKTDEGRGFDYWQLIKLVIVGGIITLLAYYSVLDNI